MVSSTWAPGPDVQAARAGGGPGDGGQVAVITAGQVVPLLPGTDFWDLWPIRAPGGALADVCGRTVWAGLSAPAAGSPGGRHDRARIRLIVRAAGEGGWSDGGPLFPDGGSAGSREWAGSCVYDRAAGRLFAYYTAAGVRGEPSLTFRQRIMGTSARVGCVGDRFEVGPWAEHRELFAADGVRYQPAAQDDGVPGFIKAFRDPFRFDDPVTGESSLLFTGSLAAARSPEYNGLIGIATARGRDDDGAPCDWELLDPLVTADGVNNELERPHVVRHAGRYYLFFSTQVRTFHPDVTGPTGLYGFVGDELLGPYRPLNGTGLVLRNPVDEPFQAYSWLVLDDLTVSSFVDAYGLGGRHPDELEARGDDEVRAHFGGTFAPSSRLVLDGSSARPEPA